MRERLGVKKILAVLLCAATVFALGVGVVWAADSGYVTPIEPVTEVSPDYGVDDSLEDNTVIGNELVSTYVPSDILAKIGNPSLFPASVIGGSVTLNANALSSADKAGMGLLQLNNPSPGTYALYVNFSSLYNTTGADLTTLALDLSGSYVIPSESTGGGEISLSAVGDFRVYDASGNSVTSVPNGAGYLVFEVASATYYPVLTVDITSSSSNESSELNISATGVPTTLSTGEDLVFYLHGVTVENGAVTAVQTMDGSSIAIDRLIITMNNSESQSDGVRYFDYTITPEGRVTILASTLADFLSGVTGTKTLGYSVDVDGVTDDDGTFHPEYSDWWTGFGTITINPSSSTTLPTAIIEPVPELSEEVIYNIADTLDIAPEQLNPSTSTDIGAPQEPTQAMRDTIKSDGYEVAYKMNTLTVEEEGYYVFEVNMPQEFVGRNISDFKMYLMERAATDSSFPSTVAITGTAIDFFFMSGAKADKIVDSLLMAVLLPAKTPFCVYLAKILLLLLGGCDVGFSFGLAGGIAVVGGVLALVLKGRGKR